MLRLDVTGLPDLPSAAAAVFHGEWLGKAQALLRPLSFRGGVGGGACPDGTALTDMPHSNPSPEGEGLLVLVFPPADHTHSAWRLAAVESLAREQAPRRVNAVASADEAAIAAALAYLVKAEGVTGQYLPLDSAGAGAVLSSAA
jgi:hypothetical protein